MYDDLFVYTLSSVVQGAPNPNKNIYTKSLASRYQKQTPTQKCLHVVNGFGILFII